MYRLVTLDGKALDLSEQAFKLIYTLLRGSVDEVVLYDQGHEVFLKDDRAVAEYFERDRRLVLKDESAVRLIVQEVKTLCELVLNKICRDCES